MHHEKNYINKQIISIHDLPIQQPKYITDKHQPS